MKSLKFEGFDQILFFLPSPFFDLDFPAHSLGECRVGFKANHLSPAVSADVNRAMSGVVTFNPILGVIRASAVQGAVFTTKDVEIKFLHKISSSSGFQAGSTIQRNFKSLSPVFSIYCLEFGGMYITCPALTTDDSLSTCIFPCPCKM